ncbi:MAG: GxxExxY protein [Calditrichaeota bacterium]|nr:MAG: GxxExxY protein [Calditrichota bacterium]
MNENEVSKIVVEKALKIHTTLGPGLFKSVYHSVLVYELEKADLQIEAEKIIPVNYENTKFDKGFRADIIVNQKLIIEIKSVKNLEDVHFKQLLTYLKLTGLKLGLLINFNEVLLKNGLKRVINGWI